MSKGLSAGTKLSHYRIVSKIGAGGMGEVYLAEDTRLNRKVALKLLPEDFAKDEGRVRRFEQEARTTSALNHPNILSVYDIGTHDGSPFIVAELLEGEELRERLNERPMSQRQAIEFARLIVSGLSAAHEKGITHRDLKPENIFITSDNRVKLLDFGLAKLKPEPLADELDSEAPTRKPLTNPGVMLGTVGYMSPEQVRGQSVDHRSDIFSFGVILYEMLAGKRPFTGDSVVETLNAILKEEAPELDGVIGKKISPALDKVMRRCLEKKPEHRFHSAHDLGFALDALFASTSSSGKDVTLPAVEAVEQSKPSTKLSVPRKNLPWILAGFFALLALAALGYALLKGGTSNERALRLAFHPPQGLSFNETQAEWAVISPDGQKIAFSAIGPDEKNRLYVRDLDSVEARALRGSDNPIEPFWSPDSRSIGYGSDGKLKRSDVSGGGNAQILCDAARLVGGTWSKDGIIVFTPDYRAKLMRVSAQGGEPKPVAMNVKEGVEEWHRLPYFLPDGRHFLFYRNHEQQGIFVGSLDSPEIKLIQIDSDSVVMPFVYSVHGWLIFIRSDTLVAQPFSASKLELSGDAVPIISGQRNDNGNRRFSVSDNGTLLWQGLWQRDYEFAWFNRRGEQIGRVGTPSKVTNGQEPRISPDGKRLLIRRDTNLWVIDMEKGTGQRIASTFAQTPIWSPDGRRIAYNGVAASTNGARGLAVKDASGGEGEMLLPGANFVRAWSPDSRFIIYTRRGVKTRLDLYALALFGERKEHLLLDSPFDEPQAEISRDGRWLAYSSDSTGDYEIYVQSFSPDGKLGPDKKRVSSGGGRLPVWSRDGKELFFGKSDGTLMSSSVKTGGAEFEFAEPKALFKTRMLRWFGNMHEYDVSNDGDRFLIGTLTGDSTVAPPTVILNWTAGLKN